jgi:hypothetical protein
MRRLVVMFSLVVACAAVARPARVLAWGVEGHRLVARIALSQMTPAAKDAVNRLLGAEDFVTISTWADEVRSKRPETYNWHFVDIPYGEKKYDAARDCPRSEKGDCIIAELVRAEQTMRDHARSDDDRREALKFFIHFMGDLHQPLHAIDNHDKGGNDVHAAIEGHPPASGRNNPNLHAAWDSVLPDQRGLAEPAYAVWLIDAVDVHPLPAGRTDYVAWALESHRLAEESVYVYPGFHVGGPGAEVVQLDAAYQMKAHDVIDLQLERAGVRLARILNSIFGS